MTFSKRLALLGVRSVLSVSKPRGLGSSYGLSDCRPFPYRQISEFTKDSNPSKNSQMETLQDSSPELINDRNQYATVFRRMTEELRPEVEKRRAEVEKIRAEVEKIRAEVEKKRAEPTKAGFIDLSRLARSYDVPIYPNSLKNCLEHYSTVSCPEQEELQKVRAELEELDDMRYAMVRYRYDINRYTQDSKKLNESYTAASTSIRGLSAELRATSREIAILGTATAVLVPALIILSALYCRMQQ